MFSVSCLCLLAKAMWGEMEAWRIASVVFSQIVGSSVLSALVSGYANNSICYEHDSEFKQTV